MNDLVIALVVQASLAVGLFVLAVRGARRSRRSAHVWGLAACVGLGLWIVCLRDSVVWAWVLPVSSLAVLSNLAPLGLTGLAGVAWSGLPGGWLRRSASTAPLLGVAVFTAVYPLLGSPPACREAWDEDGVCLQTSAATCTAAAAATLLRNYGIEASEREMVELCLTRKGTTWMGLYRGLKRKTAGTRYDVAVFDGDFAALTRRLPGPMIASTGILRGAAVDPIYEERFSWTPGVLHSVILYEIVELDRVAVADPSIGREQWTTEDLQVLWRGPALYLVERSGGKLSNSPAARQTLGAR